MHGTLEVKQDGLTAEAVHRPEWMDEVATDDMTDEQRKVRFSAHVSSCFTAYLFRICHLNACSGTLNVDITRASPSLRSTSSDADFLRCC